jgi:hypothetical protein
VLLLFASTSALAGSYTTLLPLVAGETLHGGPRTLGSLMGAAGLGALAGALFLVNRTRGEARQGSNAAGATVLRSCRSLAACSIGLGAGLTLLEIARSTLVAAPILFLIGACLIIQSASTVTVVQTTIDPDKLGRVMSLVAVAFFGGAPIGALLEGQLAKHVGPVHTFAIAGACCLAAGLAFARALPRLRAASGARADTDDDASLSPEP